MYRHRFQLIIFLFSFLISGLFFGFGALVTKDYFNFQRKYIHAAAASAPSLDPVPDKTIEAGTRVVLTFNCSNWTIDNNLSFRTRWIGHDLPPDGFSPTYEMYIRNEDTGETTGMYAQNEWTPTLSQIGTYKFSTDLMDNQEGHEGDIIGTRTFNVKVIPPVISSGKDILVVVNKNSADSIALGKYYMQKRQVPSNQVVELETETTTQVSWNEYFNNIRTPIKNFLETNHLENKIRYFLMTYGVPLKILNPGVNGDDDTNCNNAAAEPNNSNCESVDNYLVDLFNDQSYHLISYHYGETGLYYGSTDYRYISGDYFNRKAPYFLQKENSHEYLTSRIDGASAKVAMGQIDRALYSGKYTGPETTGPDGKSANSYMTLPVLNGAAGANAEEKIANYLSRLRQQCQNISSAGYNCLEDPPNFNSDGNASSEKLPGTPPDYSDSTKTSFGKRTNILWRTGERNFYGNIFENWLPGAIGLNVRSYIGVEDLRSTSASAGAGSLVKGSVAAGLTATAGATDEPYVSGLVDPYQFFNFFLNGNSSIGIKHFNFIESVFLATELNKHWRLYSIGDPLYILPDTAAIDDEAPKITNVATSWSEGSLTISWDTDVSVAGSPEVAYGNVEFGTTDSYGAIEYDRSYQPDNNIYTDVYLGHHSVTKTGLDPATKYYMKINATDPQNNTASYEFTTDTPTGGITIDGTPTITTSNMVNLNLTTSISDGAQYSISNNGTDWDEWSDLASTKSWNLNDTNYGGSASQGEKSVYVKYKNGLGIISPVYRTQTTLDNNVDDASLEINFGEESTTGPSVTLSPYAKDSISKLSAMSFSNDNFHWSDWIDFDYTHNWDINDSNYGGNSSYGTKNVYARIRDGAGNIVNKSASINYPDPNPVTETTSTSGTATSERPSRAISATTFSANWNMVSFPYLKSLLGKGLPSGYKIRKYNPSTNKYENLEGTDANLVPGAGYWIKIDDPAKFDNFKYESQDLSSLEMPVSKGWSLLGNPFDANLPLTNLTVKYKDGSTRSYQDSIKRKEVSGYVWSYESKANPKQYYFVAINPDNYKTTAHKETYIAPFRGFWMIVKSDQISSIVMNK